MYYVDIQFTHDPYEYDELCNVVLSLAVGNNLSKAVKMFDRLVKENLNTVPRTIGYIRFRYTERTGIPPTGTDIVLSKRSSNGMGDW